MAKYSIKKRELYSVELNLDYTPLLLISTANFNHKLLSKQYHKIN